jgi:hypothetical protein
MLSSNELLERYFDKDVSGNEIDGQFEYFKRIDPKLITKTKRTEFNYVMDLLIPTWKEEQLDTWKIANTSYLHEKVMCICTQEITDTCFIEHPDLPFALQVGNVCVDKINKELGSKAKSLLAKQKLEYKKQEKLKETHRECITCSKYVILKTEPIYKKQCKPCWKKDKGY